MTGNRIPAGNVVARYRGPSNLIAYQGKIPSAPTLAVRKKRKNLLAKLHLKAVSKGLRDEMVLYRLLLKESSFVLFLLSVTSLYFVLDVPYVFFYDFAVENLKIEETSAAWLTSIIGVANLLSTWICGVISDADCVKTRLFTVYGVAMWSDVVYVVRDDGLDNDRNGVHLYVFRLLYLVQLCAAICYAHFDVGGYAQLPKFVRSDLFL